MRSSEFIMVPKEPTVEEATRFVSSPRIEIGVSSTVTPDGDSRGEGRPRIVVQTVVVKMESEMKPELVMHGPTRRGEINSYLGIDARQHIFSALTGEAIGSEMRPIRAKGATDQFPALPSRWKASQESL